ncbi:type II secretion system protein GspJ [Microbulbifer aggregans]|uniref:type II secretion system protein GspJ n=1 Tax=Microbulbifer aggregans TaxID=1769779 RepID=UPI001CFEB6B1|nr:type II secretion system protein GspJ [Microbulbifer aggregans]
MMSASPFKRHRTSGSERGFTLIELLVVLVIVSIIGIGSYSLLETFFNTDRVLTGRAEVMRRLSMAMYRLDDDLRQVTVRPVKNAYSGYEPAFQGVSNEFEFTRLGAANLTGEPRGQLQRLHYGIGFPEEDSDRRDRDRYEEDDGSALLLRSRWSVLDRGPDSEPVAEPVLDGVIDMTVRYYDGENEVWLAQWPPVATDSTPGAVDVRLPEAVEITLITQTTGEMRRVFSLPEYTITAGSGSGSGSSSGGDADSADRDDDSGSGSSGSSGGADERSEDDAR